MRAHRPVSLLLTAALLIAGCGRAPGQATVATPRNAAAAWTAANQGLLGEVRQAMISPLDSDHDGATDRAEAQGTWLENDFMTADLDHDGRITEPELDRALQVQGATLAPASAGPWIAGLGAGLAGVGFAAYMAYAGMVGSNDLLLPEKNTFRATPDTYGAAYEAVRFKSHDGLNLAGWYVPAAAPTTKGLVIFHGHGSNKDTVYRKYGQWLHAKYNLFLYDSRASGDSEGKYVTLGYYEREDAKLAIAQLRAKGTTTVGLMGESMGGAVAIDAGAADPTIKAVLSDCAFDSLADAIGPRAAARHYPFTGAVAASVIATAGLRTHADLPAADPIRAVTKLAGRPFFLIHGLKDDETTPLNGERLYAAAQAPKQVWWTPEAKHANSYKVYPEEYKARVLRFFDGAL